MDIEIGRPKIVRKVIYEEVQFNLYKNGIQYRGRYVVTVTFFPEESGNRSGYESSYIVWDGIIPELTDKEIDEIMDRTV